MFQLSSRRLHLHGGGGRRGAISRHLPPAEVQAQADLLPGLRRPRLLLRQHPEVPGVRVLRHEVRIS